ncbi:MAG: UTP--glucose-1-phosphate uridylyltransferase [Anaerolineae bacterium]
MLYSPPMDRLQFVAFAERMQAEGLPQIFIDTFAYYYGLLLDGETGLITEAAIEPVAELPDADELCDSFLDAGEAAKGKTAVIKLNGGLGTSMGLDQAKSLLPIKGKLSFLDVIARQSSHTGSPLILMNSFATEANSLALLQKYDGLVHHLPFSFLQHKAPKVLQVDLTPADWPADPQLAWCPPGHGDIYAALVTSGTLEALLDAGYEYVFVSNADNLGAVLDGRILGYFAQNNFPFMMEVADRTEMDKKGGHLAQRSDGQLILRESAQCPDADKDAFQDITRHKYFNTNNLWINLPALQQVLDEQDHMLRLPMIRNRKTLDPRDPESPAVYQLETAMGSAIAVFEGAAALRVPRSRFAPVKKTDDLLAVRSDAYLLTDDDHIISNPARTIDSLTIELDAAHYKFVNDLDARFPYGPPSLLDCERLSIQGDFVFGADVVCRGGVELVNESNTAVHIPDGAVLSGVYRY